MTTFQVFLSRTSDLARFPKDRPFVQAALDAVNRAGLGSVDMQYFAARDGKPADYCRQRVTGCEIYVALVGFRYGSVVPDEAISYCELEFRAAGAAGRPRLVFLLAEPGGPADADRGLIEGFRQRIRDAALIVRTFTSAAELELEVYQALTELIASGRLTAPAPLPPDTAAFTGRDDELRLITGAVIDAAGIGGVVAIRAIGGMPGAGKTVLAVHVAHLLRDQFPDRQLFIDLLAHTPGQDQMHPQTALAGLLAAVGVDARNLPKDVTKLTGLWRQRMAGQRALLVLDNAASSDQVAPLLPGSESCLVLVTSRRHLGDLPGVVVPVLLGVLPPDQAQAMFLRLAPRAAGEPAAAVREVARLAGYLPLAVSLLARVYAKHPSWTLADLIGETRTSLLTMSAEKENVAAAFDISYRYLVPGQQQFFRRLGLHQGTTIDAYAAAALASVPLAEAAEYLDALYGEGLLTETEYRRYGMHDLIRRYALDLAATDPAADRDQALEDLLDYYQHTAGIAEALLDRLPRTASGLAALDPPPTAVPALPDRTRALAWVRAERGNLLACLDHATQAGQDTRVVALAAAVAAILRQDGPWTEGITIHAAAVQAAQRIGSQLAVAGALSHLGEARWLTGDHQDAGAALEEALGIYIDLGDRLGQANARSELGVVQRLIGSYPDAAASQQAALGIYRELGDRLGQASALSHLGTVRYLTGDYPAARLALDEALDAYRSLCSQPGQATALIHLGAVHYLTSELQAAADVLEEALGIYRELGDRQGQANALNFLGTVRRQTGNFPAAAQAQEEALGIYRELGDRQGQANALVYLGVLRRRAGNYRAATEAEKEALSIYRDLDNPLGQANALNFLGVIWRATGDYREAAEALNTALALYRDLGDRGGEVEVLNEIGALHLARSDREQAAAFHRQALDLAHDIASMHDEAQALAGLARCDLAAGHIADARAGLRQALEIFQRTGAAEAAEIATELDDLTGT